MQEEIIIQVLRFQNKTQSHLYNTVTCTNEYVSILIGGCTVVSRLDSFFWNPWWHPFLSLLTFPACKLTPPGAERAGCSVHWLQLEPSLSLSMIQMESVKWGKMCSTFLVSTVCEDSECFLPVTLLCSCLVSTEAAWLQFRIFLTWETDDQKIPWPRCKVTSVRDPDCPSVLQYSTRSTSYTNRDFEVMSMCIF